MRLRGNQLDGINAALQTGTAQDVHAALQKTCEQAESVGQFSTPHGSCMICGQDKPYAIWNGSHPEIGVCLQCRESARSRPIPSITNADQKILDDIKHGMFIRQMTNEEIAVALIKSIYREQTVGTWECNLIEEAIARLKGI